MALSSEDLVIYGEEPMAVGYKIDSVLYGKNFNQPYDKPQEGGSIAGLFSDLAVPAGLFLFQNEIKKNYFTKEDHGFLDDDLHNRLVKLQSKHSKTKKRQSHKLRKTKRKN